MSASAPALTAVIDVGKTNIKLLVVDAEGETVAQVSTPNAVQYSEPYPHFDVEAIFEWVLGGLSALAKSYRITTLVPVTHGATGALLAGGELALPVLDYEFEGVSEVDGEYDASARDFARTCSPGLPNGLNFGRQLYWLQQAFPGEFSRVTDILMYPQYFAYRLTGQKHTEVTSIGCHTDLWQPNEHSFSAFAASAGFAGKFPALRHAYESAGKLLPELARRMGLDPNVVVLTGIHDSNASYFAHAAPRKGSFGVISTGTWVVCMASGVGVECLKEELDMLANCDAFGNPVASIRFMGGREYEVLAGTDGLTASASIMDVERVLSTALPLPCFSVQGGPFRTLSGHIQGQAPIDAEGRAALATVYSALVTDHCLGLLAAGGELIVDGAFAKNLLFSEVLAALRPSQDVFVSDAAAAGTARGAAQLAAWPRLLENRLTRVAAPQLRALGAYRESWRGLVQAASR